jgi:hypothetical protein
MRASLALIKQAKGWCRIDGHNVRATCFKDHGSRQLVLQTRVVGLCGAVQMDYLNAWLAQAAPPAQLDIAAAAAAVQKHSGTADKHWAARWAQLGEAIAGVHTSVQAGPGLSS